MIPPIKPIRHRYLNGIPVRERRVVGIDGYAFIYVAEVFEAKATKIGCSRDPKIRMRQLSSEIGLPVFLRWFGGCEEAGARAIERDFHHEFKPEPMHLVGEWYGLSPEAAATAIVRIAADMGVTLDVRTETKTLKLQDLHGERANLGQLSEPGRIAVVGRPRRGG